MRLLNLDIRGVLDRLQALEQGQTYIIRAKNKKEAKEIKRCLDQIAGNIKWTLPTIMVSCNTIKKGDDNEKRNLQGDI